MGSSDMHYASLKRLPEFESDYKESLLLMISQLVEKIHRVAPSN